MDDLDVWRGGAVWFTVRMPREAKPGVYEGRITIGAEGIAATNVPLRVTVGDWIMPDPKDFRMHNLAYNEPSNGGQAL